MHHVALQRHLLPTRQAVQIEPDSRGVLRVKPLDVRPPLAEGQLALREEMGTFVRRALEEQDVGGPGHRRKPSPAPDNLVRVLADVAGHGRRQMPAFVVDLCLS